MVKVVLVKDATRTPWSRRYGLRLRPIELHRRDIVPSAGGWQWRRRMRGRLDHGRRVATAGGVCVPHGVLSGRCTRHVVVSASAKNKGHEFDDWVMVADGEVARDATRWLKVAELLEAARWWPHICCGMDRARAGLHTRVRRNGAEGRRGCFHFSQINVIKLCVYGVCWVRWVFLV